MIAFNPDDTTKPSRVNRKRKRRWRPSLISDLIKSGLTDCYRLNHNLPAVSALLAVGFAAGIYKGVNTPLLNVVFLCQKISTAFMSSESFNNGVVVWGVERLTVPLYGTANPTNHAARCFAVISGGYSLLYKGFTA